MSSAAKAALAASAAGIETLVSGGDDYEILCTVPQHAFEQFMREARTAGVAASPIGTVVAGSVAPKWLDAESRELALTRTSYSHF
jgi:thiamine-monophosphate kinase